MLAPGTAIDDKYEVLSCLGMGGFGVVYKARQIGLDRVVAIKVLHSQSELSSEALARFEREGKVLSALQHRNLALFYAFGVWQTSPYIVMEYVEGTSLQSLLSEKGRLPVEQSCNIMRQVCEALACAHAHGVIHRDLKPTNVMLVNDEVGLCVKLIDFGLAKILSDDVDVQKLTEAGSTVGTVEFMSPEQCTGHQADNRSDVYSAACVFYKCLTGKTPFVGEHSLVVMQQHLMETPPRINQFGDFPAGLQLVLDKALAKEPPDRYQSADEMIADLKTIASGSKQQLIAHDAVVPVSSAHHAAIQAQKKDRKSLLLVGLLLVGLLATLAAAVVPQFLKTASAPPQRLSMDLKKDAESYYASHSFINSVDRHKLEEQYQAAIAAYSTDHCLDKYQLGDCHRMLAFLYRCDGRTQDALREASAACSYMNESGEYRSAAEHAVQEYAYACFKQGHPQYGLDKLVEFEKHFNFHDRACPELRATEARAYVRLGNWKKADEILKQTEAMAPPQGKWPSIDEAIRRARQETDACRDGLNGPWTLRNDSLVP